MTQRKYIPALVCFFLLHLLLKKFATQPGKKQWIYLCHKPTIKSTDHVSAFLKNGWIYNKIYKGDSLQQDKLMY